MKGRLPVKGDQKGGLPVDANGRAPIALDTNMCSERHIDINGIYSDSIPCPKIQISKSERNHQPCCLFARLARNTDHTTKHRRRHENNKLSASLCSACKILANQVINYPPPSGWYSIHRQKLIHTDNTHPKHKHTHRDPNPTTVHTHTHPVHNQIANHSHTSNSQT